MRIVAALTTPDINDDDPIDLSSIRFGTRTISVDIKRRSGVAQRSQATLTIANASLEEWNKGPEEHSLRRVSRGRDGPDDDDTKIGLVWKLRSLAPHKRYPDREEFELPPKYTADRE